MVQSEFNFDTRFNTYRYSKFQNNFDVICFVLSCLHNFNNAGTKESHGPVGGVDFSPAG
jgi:hypothetical protein